MSQTFRAITTGVMILGLGLPSQAEEVWRYINVQPLSRIRELCAQVELPDLGCVTFDRAADNPRIVFCYMHIHHTDFPWEEEALLTPLRAQCLEGAGR